jgi:hypothetical protein
MDQFISWYCCWFAFAKLFDLVRCDVFASSDETPMCTLGDCKLLIKTSEIIKWIIKIAPRRAKIDRLVSLYTEYIRGLLRLMFNRWLKTVRYFSFFRSLLYFCLPSYVWCCCYFSAKTQCLHQQQQKQQHQLTGNNNNNKNNNNFVVL